MDLLTRERCNLTEVKNVLTARCSPSTSREMVVTAIPISGSNCRFIALDGTPPKGFGIYVYAAERKMLSLYDAKGKRFKEYELEAEIDFGS